MTEQTQEIKIAELVTTLAAMFPSVSIGGSTIGAYVSMLKDIPLDILQTAIEQVAVECKFFPTVAEVREKALTLQLPELENGMSAWGEVKKSISKYGFYQSPKFDNPIIAKAVDCLGWKNLCSSENEEADRAHFARIYDDLVRRQLQDARLLPRARALKESGVKQLER